jgi:hypothetical protein
MQPGFDPGTAVMLLAMRCSVLVRCATWEKMIPADGEVAHLVHDRFDSTGFEEPQAMQFVGADNAADRLVHTNDTGRVPLLLYNTMYTVATPMSN